MQPSTKRIVLIVCASIVGSVAAILDSAALYFLSGFLMTIPLSAWAFGVLSLRGLQLRALKPQPVVAGDVMQIPLELRNLGMAPRFNIVVEVSLPEAFSGAGRRERWGLGPSSGIRQLKLERSPARSSAAEKILTVAPGQRALAACQVRTTRRGRFLVGPMAASHLDALGLYTVRRGYAGSSHALVYPRSLGVKLGSLLGGDLLGSERTAQNRGSADGSDFYGIRPYRPGDEMRRIHWATTARMRELMVVERETYASLSLVVVLDLAAESGDADAPLEVLIRLAAQFVEDSIRRSSTVDLVLMNRGGEIACVLSRSLDLHRALEALARVDPAAELPFQSSALLQSSVGHNPSLVLLTAARDGRVAEIERVCRRAGWRGVTVMFDQTQNSDPHQQPPRGALPLWRLAAGDPVDHSEKSYYVEPLARF